MIQTFYLCLLAVILFYSVFFSLVVKMLRETNQRENGHQLELNISSHI